MSTDYVSIIDVKDHVGEEVTIGAWVANKSGKGKIAFLQLRDGTAFSKPWPSNQTLSKNLVKKKELKNSIPSNTLAKKRLSLSQGLSKKIHVQNLVMNWTSQMSKS